jgi:hypothetical protein
MVRSRGLVLVVAVLGLGACNAVLGLESAEVDPSFQPGTGGAGGSGGGDAGSVCEAYCSKVMSVCTGANAVYTTLSVCQKVCATLPEGTVGDEFGNTANCRLRNANLAETTGEPEVHCPIAGPGGNGVCGDNCEGYCVTMQAACKSRFDRAFSGLQECKQDCDALPDPGGYDVSQKTGNSVQCRLWHVSAATADPDTHCGHALGEAPCNAVEDAGGDG